MTLDMQVAVSKILRKASELHTRIKVDKYNLGLFLIAIRNSHLYTHIGYKSISEWMDSINLPRNSGSENITRAETLIIKHGLNNTQTHYIDIGDGLIFDYQTIPGLSPILTGLTLDNALTLARIFKDDKPGLLLFWKFTGHLEPAAFNIEVKKLYDIHRDMADIPITGTFAASEVWSQFFQWAYDNTLPVNGNTPLNVTFKQAKPGEIVITLNYDLPDKNTKTAGAVSERLLKEN